VLCSDRRIGITSIEAEPEIEKRIPVHRDWSLLYAADDYAAVFDIADFLKEKLPDLGVSVRKMSGELLAAYNRKRLEEANSIYLESRGHFQVPEETKPVISNKIAEYDFPLQIMVAGFDETGVARILTLEPRQGQPEERKIQRHDSPGFWAIGSGSDAAVHLLYRRNTGPKLPLRKALYFTLEAKYFGEEGASVGIDTDLSVRRHGVDPIIITENTIEELLIPEIVQKLEPKDLRPRHAAILNALEELRGHEEYAKVEAENKSQKKKKASEWKRAFMRNVFGEKGRK
jgi:hypothetical protein